MLANHLDGFVKHITVYPDLVAIFSLPEILQQFNQMLEVKSNEQIFLSYDTTINLGDCYISAVVFKNVLFKESPLQPLAFVIHDRKLGTVHDTFFRFLKTACPKLEKNMIPRETDREQGIRSAIKKSLPSNPILLCWNHLIGDFKTWLRKNKCDSDNIAVYLDDTRQMLKSDSEEDFLQKLDTLTSKWSEPVVEHFETYFKSDILNHSGKWIIEKFDGLYDPFSGITNNLSESYNAILKQEQEWEELPVDMMVLGFHFLQSFDYFEILRGLSGAGDYHLNNL